MGSKMTKVRVTVSSSTEISDVKKLLETLTRKVSKYCIRTIDVSA